MVPIWETPAEYDRRKLAVLDFAPICEIEECAQHAGRAVMCAQCRVVQLWLCVPHSDGVVEHVSEPVVRCEECGEVGSPPSMIEVVSLHGWLSGYFADIHEGVGEQ